MNLVPDLLSWVPPNTDRFGSSYDSALDYSRLNAQQRKVWEVMRDGKYRTLRQISELTGAPEASASARLRDLRNIHGLKVERARRERGLHEYRVVV